MHLIRLEYNEFVIVIFGGGQELERDHRSHMFS